MDELAASYREAEHCQRCPLHLSRHRVVFGEGNPRASVLLVGEGPGQTEDQQGRPFVGSAGQLLDRILAAAGFNREEVYITNTVLCRPPGNRVPTPGETAACYPYLETKLRVIKPAIVVVLGATAARVLIDAHLGITKLRGQAFTRDGITFYPTFHPAALLRDPAKKRPAWEDFKRIRDHYRTLNQPNAGSPAPPDTAADSAPRDARPTL